jgi:hypothetical protein
LGEPTKAAIVGGASITRTATRTVSVPSSFISGWPLATPLPWPPPWRATPLSQVDCQAFRGTLGVKVVMCRPADPEAKGLIEGCHDHLERSFRPGRTFSGPADFNTQLHDWLQVVNTRQRRALGCAPTDRIARPTKPRWCRCHPCRRWSAGGTPPGWPGTTTCGSTPTTIPCTRRRSGAGSGSGSTCTACRRCVRAGSWPTTNGPWCKHQTTADPDHAAAGQLRRARTSPLLRPVDREVERRNLSVHHTPLGDEGGVV